MVKFHSSYAEGNFVFTWPFVCQLTNWTVSQTFKTGCLDPVFTHGQHYVALSHCTSSNHIKVLFKGGSQQTVTQNVVYPEVLLD